MKARLSIDITPEEHRQMKLLAAMEGVSLKEYVMTSVRKRLQKDLRKKPNAETLKTFRLTDKEDELVACKDAEEMFAKLDM